MALAQCRECGGRVSSDTDSCPHCAAPSPTPEALDRAEARQLAGRLAWEVVKGAGLVWLAFRYGHYITIPLLIVGMLVFAGAMLALRWVVLVLTGYEILPPLPN